MCLESRSGGELEVARRLDERVRTAARRLRAAVADIHLSYRDEMIELEIQSVQSCSC